MIICEFGGDPIYGSSVLIPDVSPLMAQILDQLINVNLGWLHARQSLPDPTMSGPLRLVTAPLPAPLLGCAYLPGRSHSGLPWFSGFSRALSPPMPEKISLTQTLPVTVSRTAMVAEFSVPHAAI